MKYRRTLVKAAALLTAFSVVLSGEGASFGAVYAASNNSSVKNTFEKFRGGVYPARKIAHIVDI